MIWAKQVKKLITPQSSTRVRRSLTREFSDSFTWIGETLYAAAVRKTKEETGVLAEPLGVLGVFNTFFPSSAWGDSDTHTINVIVHLRTKTNEVVVDDTSEEHCWIGHNDIKRYDPYVQEIMRMVKSRIAL